MKRLKIYLPALMILISSVALGQRKKDFPTPPSVPKEEKALLPEKVTTPQVPLPPVPPAPPAPPKPPVLPPPPPLPTRED